VYWEEVYFMTPSSRWVSVNEGAVIVFTSTSCLRF
jgi:hypothetical protein